MKKSNLTSLIALLALIILVFLAFLYFFYQMLVAKGQYVSKVSETTIENARQAEEIKNVTTSLDAATSVAQTVDSYFVTADGEVDFIDHIETLAKNNKLTVVTNSVQINNTKALSANNLEYLALRVSVSGSWSNIYLFLHSVENMPYQIVVDQGDISNTSDAGTHSGTAWQGVFDIQVVKKIK